MKTLYNQLSQLHKAILIHKTDFCIRYVGLFLRDFKVIRLVSNYEALVILVDLKVNILRIFGMKIGLAEFMVNL